MWFYREIRDSKAQEIKKLQKPKSRIRLQKRGGNQRMPGDHRREMGLQKIGAAPVI